MPSRRYRPAAVVILALVAISDISVRAGETVVDPERGYSLTLPEGFVAFPDDVDFGPTIDRAFYRGDLSDDRPDLILLVDPMNGTIGREPLTPEHLPPGFEGELSRTKWKTFDVDLFVVPEEANGVTFLTYNVQIPIEPRAIQLKLFGPADRATEMEATLAEVLAGFDGESNWSRQDSDPRKLRSLLAAWISRDQFVYVLVTCLVAFGIVGLALYFFLSRFGPRGAVLIAGACIFAAGWAIPENDFRELRGLEGALRLLGIAGILLGIADALRRRKTKSTPEASNVASISSIDD